MTTYDRRGIQNQNAGPNPMAPLAPSEQGAPSKGEEPIRVDGYQQVLAMLKIADPEFRQSLLKRLNARDPQLAARIQRELRIAGIVR